MRTTEKLLKSARVDPCLHFPNLESFPFLTQCGVWHKACLAAVTQLSESITLCGRRVAIFTQKDY